MSGIMVKLEDPVACSSRAVASITAGDSVNPISSTSSQKGPAEVTTFIKSSIKGITACMAEVTSFQMRHQKISLYACVLVSSAKAVGLILESYFI